MHVYALLLHLCDFVIYMYTHLALNCVCTYTLCICDNVCIHAICISVCIHAHNIIYMQLYLLS